MKTDGTSSERRKCSVCSRMTGRYKSWSYVKGIEIVVPICNKCANDFGYCADLAMDAHLKGISQTVRMSHIITVDEKTISELKEKAVKS